MKRAHLAVSLATALLPFAGCSRGGGGGGGSSTAPLTSSGAGPLGSSTSPGATQPLRGQDYTGTWDVTGTDPTYGAYRGTAVVSAAPGSAQSFTVRRLVTFSRKLPDGRDLLQAWNATATKTVAGLAVSVTLERADTYKRVKGSTRTGADMQPLAVTASLAGQGGNAPANIPLGTALTGTFAAATGGPGVTETWTFSNAPAPLFPETDRKSIPLHAVDPAIRNAQFLLYGPTYHTLPDIKPFVSRPEFQAAQHFVSVDHTAKSFYRQGGRTRVVVLDKITDEIAILEETHRADAFSLRLFEKAQRADADVKNIHMLSCGMIAGIDPVSKTRWVSGDGVLWQACYIESQAFRYLVTKDPEALANVQKAVLAVIACVEICPNKTEFARAVDELPSGWPASVGAIPGTGAYAGLCWLPNGNNDMLHGIDMGFYAAEMVLPAGDPLRARIGACARSLLDNVKLAQSGYHLIFLSNVAWKTTGDPALLQKYKDSIKLTTSFLDQQWMSLGDGILQVQGVADWSGHHLGECDMINLGLLGGTNPSGDEQAWRDAARSGARAAFANMATARAGLLSVVAASQGAPGASDVAKDVLEEIPYPKPVGDFEVDLRITSDFCVSPYPGLPWKLTFMTSPDCEQAIEGRPYFHRGTDECYWKDGPQGFRGSGNSMYWVPQDYLHAYWFARLTNLLGPND